MNTTSKGLACGLLCTAMLSATMVGAEGPDQLWMPYIDGPWWQVAGNPDLGEYTTDRQQPVDFAVWQAADGTWQLWSCIRYTNAGGNTRVLHGWEGEKLTDTDWRPLGIMMEADEAYGETPGGLQAPHVVKHDDTYYMLYGDWENICLATSQDGMKFERYVKPDGRTGLFSEGAGTNTRDIMAIKIGELWHGYYTAYPNRQGAVFCRTSSDLKNWSESTNVAFGGRVGTSPYGAECPHVIARHGTFYLFRTQKYGADPRTSVYCSNDPMNFGINQDRRYYVCELPAAAPEIIHHEGKDYIAALLPSLQGIQIAELGWTARPTEGEAIFDLDNAAHREGWRMVSGDLPEVFTPSSRHRFTSPAAYFVSTGELSGSRFDDRMTCVIESPSFEIDSKWLFTYIFGGMDRDHLYVAIHDAETGEELARVAPTHDSAAFQPYMVNVSSHVGRVTVLRIVDDTEAGRICFGGLYRGVVHERSASHEIDGVSRAGL